MTKCSAVPAWQSALVLLTGTIITLVVTACLYWAQVIFIPLALAVFLTFILSPIVTLLQRRGLGRVLSVIIVVFCAALVMSGTVWMLAAEISSLVDQVPNYSDNIKAKVKYLQNLGQGLGGSRLEQMINDINNDIQGKSRNGEQPVPGTVEGGAPVIPQPPTAILRPDSFSWLSPGAALLQPLVESFAGGVLVIFMLLKREDLPTA